LKPLFKINVFGLGRVGTELRLNSFALVDFSTTKKHILAIGRKTLEDARSIVSSLEQKTSLLINSINLCKHESNSFDFISLIELV